MLESFDTAVFVPGRGLYAFADDLVWRYGDVQRLADPGFPKPITAEFPGAFARALDAAVVRPDGGLYLFRGDQHIRYDVARRRPELGYPRRYADDWPGIFDRGGIDAALAWAPDIVYVFSGDRYTSFSPLRSRVRSGFPKSIAGNWPGLDRGPLRAALALPGGVRILIGPTRASGYDRDGHPLAEEFELPFRTGAANGAAAGTGNIEQKAGGGVSQRMVAELSDRRLSSGTHSSPPFRFSSAAAHHRPRAFIDEAAIIRDTITEFERPAPATKATEAQEATEYPAFEWAAAEDLHEQEGGAPRGERWVIETYEPGRGDLQPCDGEARVA